MSVSGRGFNSHCLHLFAAFEQLESLFIVLFASLFVMLCFLKFGAVLYYTAVIEPTKQAALSAGHEEHQSFASHITTTSCTPLKPTCATPALLLHLSQSILDDGILYFHP
jgi:hypothetical protein